MMSVHNGRANNLPIEHLFSFYRHLIFLHATVYTVNLSCDSLLSDCLLIRQSFYISDKLLNIVAKRMFFKFTIKEVMLEQPIWILLWVSCYAISVQMQIYESETMPFFLSMSVRLVKTSTKECHTYSVCKLKKWCFLLSEQHLKRESFISSEI